MIMNTKIHSHQKQIKRCIMIFPKFKNQSAIDEIREKYDPLVKLVEPHITLVFPFESELGTEEISKHIISVLEGVLPFKLGLKGIVPVNSGGNYLFLEITEGRASIEKLHKRLYSGILEKYKKPMYSYHPHLTVGVVDDEKEYIKAIEETRGITEAFRAQINTISVEIIGENEASIIELEYTLGE